MSTSALHVSRSAARALDLLEAVVQRRVVNLTNAAAAAGLTPSTALRHLKALQARGYLRRDEHGLYTVGPTFLRLALAAVGASPVTERARPHLQRLADDTGESAYLAVREGDEALYVATVESSRAIRHAGWVGRTVPLDGTAVGEALLGVTPGRASVASGAVESDITAVAAPVMGAEGTPIAALSVIGPSHRMRRAAVRVASAEVQSAALGLAADLGFGDWTAP